MITDKVLIGLFSESYIVSGLNLTGGFGVLNFNLSMPSTYVRCHSTVDLSPLDQVLLVTRQYVLVVNRSRLSPGPHQQDQPVIR